MDNNDALHSGTSARVALFLPQSDEALTVPQLLREAGVTPMTCVTPDHLISAVREGTEAIIIGAELLSPPVIDSLSEILTNQPTWSDLPVIVILPPGSDAVPGLAPQSFPGDVEYVTRPVRSQRLLSRVQAALRRRRRQYAVRDEILALKQAHSSCRALFDSIDEAFCIIRVIFDDSGKAVDYLLLETNDAFEHHTGIANARGKSMRELAPELEDHWFEVYGQIALTGEPTRFISHASQLGRWFDVYAFRHGEPDKGEVAILFSDITDRKTAEDALRRSESRFAKIFNFAPALIGITTLEQGTIVDVNEKALQFLGYRREDVVGRTTVEIGLWGNEEERARILRAVETQNGSLRNLEISYRGKGGEIFTGLYCAEVIDFDHGRYLLSMVQDITDLKASHEEIARLNRDLASQVAGLKEANTELEAFNRMVSHDLRQPLNNMGLSIQAVDMLCGDTLDKECKGHVQRIYQRILDMNDLINSLLNFSNSTRGTLKRERLDLSEMARSIVGEVKFNAPERRVTFTVAKGMEAHADPGLVRAVLQNLIDNAWKYTSMRQDAVIEIGVTEAEGTKAFYVKDNGTGFDIAQADDLFAPFKRLPGAEQYTGFGIGLATVSRIIRRHGGRVWAESEPDRGATFFFTLP